MRSNGFLSKKICTFHGWIRIRRRVYICHNCNYRVCPLDEKLDMSNNSISMLLTKYLSMLASLVPFEHGIRIIKYFLGFSISKRFFQETVYNIRKQISAYYQKDLTEDECNILAGQNSEADISYIGIDGLMVPTISEEDTDKNGKNCPKTGKNLTFKENKLAILFKDTDIEVQENKKGDKTYRIKQKRFVTSLGKGVEPFAKALKKAVSIHRINKAKTVVLIADGAEWIRNLHKKLFPYAVRILDWYHAMEHLWDAAKELYGESDRCKQWVEPLISLLYNGHTDQVLQQILHQAKQETGSKSTALLNLYNYYHKNKEAMKYKEFREKGYFIGSGSIESANKYVVTSRLKMTGCRWTIQNADSLIWVKAKYHEGDWDEFWNKMNFRKFSRGEFDMKMVA